MVPEEGGKILDERGFAARIREAHESSEASKNSTRVSARRENSVWNPDANSTNGEKFRPRE